jgi:hypothetical protein
MPAYLYIVLFVIGVLLVSGMLYVALNPRSLGRRGETADLRYIWFAFIVILSTVGALASVWILGDKGPPPFK